MLSHTSLRQLACPVSRPSLLNATTFRHAAACARSAQNSHRMGWCFSAPQPGPGHRKRDDAPSPTRSPLPLAHYHTMGDILRLEVAPPHVRTVETERYWRDERELRNMYVEYSDNRQIVAIGVMLPMMCLSHAGWDQLPSSTYPEHPDEPTIYEVARAEYTHGNDRLTITLVGANEVATTHTISLPDAPEDRIVVGKDAAGLVSAIYIEHASTSVASFQGPSAAGAVSAAGGRILT